jgi:hypothetical protein
LPISPKAWVREAAAKTVNVFAAGAEVAVAAGGWVAGTGAAVGAATVPQAARKKASRRTIEKKLFMFSPRSSRVFCYLDPIQLKRMNLAQMGSSFNRLYF